MARDLFELSKTNDLLVVDSFQGTRKMIHLTLTTSVRITSDLKKAHGIPEIMRGDNGLQCSFSNFRSFANSYGFYYLTSSLKLSQSNRLAERSFKTVKNLLKKSDDQYTSLLNYRATPLSCDLCPAE